MGHPRGDRWVCCECGDTLALEDRRYRGLSPAARLLASGWTREATTRSVWVFGEWVLEPVNLYRCPGCRVVGQ